MSHYYFAGQVADSTEPPSSSVLSRCPAVCSLVFADNTTPVYVSSTRTNWRREHFLQVHLVSSTGPVQKYVCLCIRYLCDSSERSPPADSSDALFAWYRANPSMALRCQRKARIQSICASPYLASETGHVHQLAAATSFLTRKFISPPVKARLLQVQITGSTTILIMVVARVLVQHVLHVVI